MSDLVERVAQLSRDWHKTIDPEDAFHTAFAKKLVQLLEHHGERVWVQWTGSGEGAFLPDGSRSIDKTDTPALLVPLGNTYPDNDGKG